MFVRQPSDTGNKKKSKRNSVLPKMSMTPKQYYKKGKKQQKKYEKALNVHARSKMSLFVRHTCYTWFSAPLYYCTGRVVL